MQSTLRLLGGVSLEAGGTPVRGRAGQRQRLAFLALVAATPAGLSRDRLVGLLWPEAEPDRARHLLSHSIYVLRQTLGDDALLVGSDVVRVNPAAVWCDVQDFELALQAGDDARAVELYLGPFLDGFFLADNVEFERWVDGERERLGHGYARALETLASERETAGDPSGAAIWWRRRAIHDRHNTRTTIRLARVLEASGEIAGAFRVALAHEALLREELGLGPPRELIEEIGRLKQKHAGRATGNAGIPPALPLEPITKPAEATVPATTIPARQQPPRRRRWWHVLAGAAVAVALALSAIVMRQSGAGTPLDANLLAVAPFDALGGELELWREGLVDLLSRNLDGAGSLRTVSPSVVIHRWNGRADPASASALARRTGAGLIVFGNLVAIGPDSVRLTATILDGARRRTIGEAQLRGDTQHMDRLADSLTVSLLSELGRTRDIMAVRTASLRATSLPALKAFLEGERLYRRGAWNSAQAAYRKALAHDSTLVPALRHLAWSVGWGSPADYALSRAYFLRAGELNHGLTQRESLLVAGDSLRAAISQPDNLPAGSHRFLRRRMFATLDQAVRLYPDDPEIWYQVGEDRYHFGWEERVSRAQALSAFDRSIALDSSFSPAYAHAPTLGLILYGLEGWDRYTRPYLVRRSTDDDGSHQFLNALLKRPPAQASDADSAIRSATLQQLFGALISLWDFPDSGETIVRLGRGLVAIKPPSTDHHQDPLFRRQLLAAALAYRGHLREARTMIESGVTVGTIPSVPAGIVLLGSSHPDNVDSTFKRWLRAGTFWPSGDWPVGGPPGALAWALPWWSARRDTLALADYARRADSVQRTTSRTSWKESAQYLAGAARAYVVLIRGDTAAALSFFQAPHHVSYPWARVTEGQILSRQGRDADAIELFEEAYPLQWWGPTRVLAKLEAARAAERLGQKKRAAAHYQFVVDVWRHADPELERYVREARARLERLAAEG